MSDFRGKKNVLLVFYPLAFTGVCRASCAACGTSSQVPERRRRDPRGFRRPVADPQIWAAEQGYTFPLLSDFWPHGAVAEAYGVFTTNSASPTAARFRHRQGRRHPVRRDERPRRTRDQAAWEKALTALKS
ncbi:redoxin domain-containing protein [Rhodococcus hoagii]|nr:redoxin domain-containing protein [Prescottella equi]